MKTVIDAAIFIFHSNFILFCFISINYSAYFMIIDDLFLFFRFEHTFLQSQHLKGEDTIRLACTSFLDLIILQGLLTTFMVSTFFSLPSSCSTYSSIPSYDKAAE
jgi:hypothetical protein